MKVSTICTVLKSVRARAEANKLLVQVGQYEIYALATAGHILEDNVLLTLALASSSAILVGNTKEDTVTLLPLDKDGFNAIRNAYKTLEKDYSPEQEIAIGEDGGAELKAEPLPSELGDIGELNKWLKSEVDSPIIPEYKPES